MAQHSVELQITGMHCASCIARVEGMLRQVDGVTDCAVNLATGRAVVEQRDPLDAGSAGIPNVYEVPGRQAGSFPAGAGRHHVGRHPGYGH